MRWSPVAFVFPDMLFVNNIQFLRIHKSLPNHLRIMLVPSSIFLSEKRKTGISVESILMICREFSSSKTVSMDYEETGDKIENLALLHSTFFWHM